MNDIDKALGVLLSGVEIEEPKGELRRKLIDASSSRQPLVVKLGVDPTAPDLHLGHAVVLEKMAQFQRQGHHIILIIGDFTAMIGDPTGRNTTRPPLSTQEIEENAQTYLAQVGKILDVESVDIRRNSEWLGELKFEDVVKLTSKMTVAQIMQREDFKNRFSDGTPISLHELLYPIMQGYDSVAIKADIELGGTDQLFNNLVGRTLQSSFDQKGQMVLCMPILVGTDGVEKMSKSKNNYVGLTDAPSEMFGKIMSIPDSALNSYCELVSGWEEAERESRLAEYASGSLHPMELKKDLAEAVVARFHSEKDAKTASELFRKNYQSKNEAVFSRVKPSDLGLTITASLLDVVLALEPTFSRSHAKRMIAQSAVRVDGEPVLDPNMEVSLSSSPKIEVGKHKKVELVT